MAKAKWLPKKYKRCSDCLSSKNEVPNLYLYERENNYPIAWSVSDGLKKDCVSNGI